MNVQKMGKEKKRQLLLQVGERLDRCRMCHYVKPHNIEICEGCPNYEEINNLRKQLFPDRSRDFSNKQIQSILKKGDMINRNELEYLLTVKVPIRVIADRLNMGVRELNHLIDSLGI